MTQSKEEARQKREQARAQALRANLKRRKEHAAPPAEKKATDGNTDNR